MEQCMPANAPWPGWSLTLALPFDCHLALFHWGFRRWLLYRGKVFAGETEAVSSCYGPDSPAAGMVPTAGCSRLLLPVRSRHKAQPLHSEIPFPAPSGQLAAEHPPLLGARSTQSPGSSQLLRRSPCCPAPASRDLGWKEWLWHLLSRLKFGSRVPVLFMQNWHVSLSWAMWPRFQPLYLQNITHVPAPPASPWFQRDYSHVHAYPGLCRAEANPAAFSWFTAPLWRWKSDTGAAQQEKENQPDTSSVFFFRLHCHQGSLQEGLLLSTVRALLNTRG